MPEPVDPLRDWVRTRRSARPVVYREFDPATDQHAAPGVPCLGDRGPLGVADAAVGDGAASRKTADWTLCPLYGKPAFRPRERSLIVDGNETWVVGDVKGQPPGPWDCPGCVRA